MENEHRKSAKETRTQNTLPQTKMEIYTVGRSVFLCSRGLLINADIFVICICEPPDALGRDSQKSY
jgi:hypothetical protein